MRTKNIAYFRVESLSSRRAWIEISMISSSATPMWSRSPHGERGLKYRVFDGVQEYELVALLTESVD